MKDTLCEWKVVASESGLRQICNSSLALEPNWLSLALETMRATPPSGKVRFFCKIIELVYVRFVLFIVCLYICVRECLLQNNNKTKNKNNTASKQHPCVRGPLRECGSIRSGASALPYYCAPLVCVTEVIE